MSTLFKKHFWAVNLAALALLAWLSALTVNEVTKGVLFMAPTPPNVSVGESGQAEAAKRGRVARDEDARDILVDRHIFDLNPMEDEAAASTTEEEEAPSEEPKAEGELEESDLPIDLMGTLVSHDPEQSMATLNISGENKLGWIGQEFMEGKAKIVAIAPRHIIIQEGVALTVIKLWTDKAKAGAKGKGGPKGRGRDKDKDKRKAPKAKRDEKKKSGRPERKDYSKGVKKTGPYDYEIDRSMLDEQLKDLSELGRQARVVPNYRNGKYEGFKLVGVR
ncbi:MAG: type II secretion system protein GspC, partial [Myxococcota bacterium]|nr:type II secretion system protein GspC [Myxococcota bacterium]